MRHKVTMIVDVFIEDGIDTDDLEDAIISRIEFYEGFKIVQIISTEVEESETI